MHTEHPEFNEHVQEPTPESSYTSTETNDFHPKKQPSGLGAILDFIWTVAKVAAIVFLVRTFVLQPFLVEGSSMAPRFESNDYLLVDKFSYRLHEPDRGDIIVFHYPYNEEINYVKRIIGLPGEKVEIKDGNIYIFNEQHPNGWLLPEPYVEPGNETTVSPPNEQATFTVPADHYFVVGDNREGSSDSREWGSLPENEIIGKVFVQAYPLDRFSLIPHASY